MTCKSKPPRPASRKAEERARKSLEAKIGRSLSDDEWRIVQEHLTAFFRVLASWQ